MHLYSHNRYDSMLSHNVQIDRRLSIINALACLSLVGDLLLYVSVIIYKIYYIHFFVSYDNNNRKKMCLFIHTSTPSIWN
jgi:hypothetical protein